MFKLHWADWRFINVLFSSILCPHPLTAFILSARSSIVYCIVSNLLLLLPGAGPITEERTLPVTYNECAVEGKNLTCVSHLQVERLDKQADNGDLNKWIFDTCQCLSVCLPVWFFYLKVGHTVCPERYVIFCFFTIRLWKLLCENLSRKRVVFLLHAWRSDVDTGCHSGWSKEALRRDFSFHN